jgi:L-rhamnose mutarotase
MLSLSRLRPECVPEYIRRHQQVWPELLDAYRQAGITQISCFLNGLNLIVYSEYELDVYETAREALSRNGVEVRWQALMQTLRDQTVHHRLFGSLLHASPSRCGECGMKYITIFHANLNYAYLTEDRYEFVIRQAYEMVLDTLQSRFPDVKFVFEASGYA